MANFEEWGRARAVGFLARAMAAPETSAREAGELLRQKPSAKILLVGLYQKMGQFLCATPLIRAFSSAWPKASLHFLGNPANIAAAKANPHLGKVWVWKKSAFWEWPGQMLDLRSERFDLALLLTTERPSATGVLIARAAGARWTAAYAPSIPGEWAKDTSALCHIRIPAGPEKNEVEKYLGLARAFGVAPQGLQPELLPVPEDEMAASFFFSRQNFMEKGPLVGLFIGGKAERSDRLWPVEHFVQLAEMLKKAGMRVIAVSPPSSSEEHARFEAFRRALAWPCPVIEEASPVRAAAFLRRLDLLVCPDGGVLHVAAAVGTPTLGLFFSTDPDVWRHDLPQGILDGRGKPSADLRPETVADEVLRFLGVPARG